MLLLCVSTKLNKRRYDDDDDDDDDDISYGTLTGGQRQMS